MLYAATEAVRSSAVNVMPVSRLNGRRWRRTLLLSLLAGVLVPNGGQAQEVAAPAPPAELHPGDVLEISVWKREEFSCECKVAADSSLSHPLFRNIKVAGVPFSTATERIRTFLLQYEANPEFVLEPQFSVYVAGNVAQPGMYLLGPEVSIARALVEAGGSLDPRQLQRVRLLRGGEQYLLNLTRGSGGPVRSGDQIFVQGNLFGHVIRDYVTPASSIITSALFLYQLLF